MKTKKDNQSVAEVIAEVTSAPATSIVVHPSTFKLFEIMVGSQGGVGKTTTIVDRACYYAKMGIPTTKIDLDESAKKFGSFHCFFPDVSCCKQSVHKRAIKVSVGEVSEEDGLCRAVGSSRKEGEITVRMGTADDFGAGWSVEG